MLALYALLSLALTAVIVGISFFLLFTKKKPVIEENLTEKEAE